MQPCNQHKGDLAVKGRPVLLSLALLLSHVGAGSCFYHFNLRLKINVLFVSAGKNAASEQDAVFRSLNLQLSVNR